MREHENFEMLEGQVNWPLPKRWGSKPESPARPPDKPPKNQYHILEVKNPVPAGSRKPPLWCWLSISLLYQNVPALARSAKVCHWQWFCFETLLGNWIVAAVVRAIHHLCDWQWLAVVWTLYAAGSEKQCPYIFVTMCGSNSCHE